MIEQELYNHIFRLYLLMICSVANPCQTIRSLTTNLRYKAESNTPVIFDTELRNYSNGITVCIRTVVSIDLGRKTILIKS